jgi:hypothetical protein
MVLIMWGLTCKFSTAQQCPQDLNGNGVIDGSDLLELLSVYGLSCNTDLTSSLVISEIHYNPSPDQGQDSEWEFIEIYNPLSTSINISGWHLTDAVECVLPIDTWIEPGRYIVFVSQLESYAGELPYSTQIFEWYNSEELDNSGESIRLLNSNGVEVDIITYSDTAGWPEEVDGGGASLEWRGLGYDNILSGSWTASNAFGGSPGVANSTWAD